MNQGTDGNRTLLIDLDGVVYQAGQPIEGAVEAIEWIRRRGIPHLFVTNTTSRSRAALLQKFERLGFSATAEEIMTPIVAAADWLARRGLERAALYLPQEAQTDFKSIVAVAADDTAAVDAVVIGDLGTAWDFDRLNSAFRRLMTDPAPCLLALGMTRYWRGPDGLQLDVAPFVKALEHATGCEAIVVGKPAAAFFEAALERLSCSAAETLMIGDDIQGDIDAAQACGIRGIQVRTGKFRASDLGGPVKPFAVLDSFADLPAWWAGGGGTDSTAFPAGPSTADPVPGDHQA